MGVFRAQINHTTFLRSPGPRIRRAGLDPGAPKADRGENQGTGGARPMGSLAGLDAQRVALPPVFQRITSGDFFEVVDRLANPAFVFAQFPRHQFRHPR